MSEERGARRVQLDADRVHAAHDGIVQALLESRLVDIVLVLSHADGARIDFHELRERVHEPPADGNGAADRGIETGKLLAGGFGSGIDRCPALIHHDHQDAPQKIQTPYESFGFPASRPISYGNGFNLELLA